MRKLCILMFLMMVGLCLGADYYVSTSGSGNGLAPETPDDNIQAGIDQATDGDTIYLMSNGNHTSASTYLYFETGEDNKDITITNYNGSAPTIVTTHTQYILYAASTCDNGSVTISNVTFAPTGTTLKGIYTVSTTFDVTITDCTMDLSASTGQAVYFDYGATQITNNLTMTNVDITPNASLTVPLIKFEGCGDVTLTNVDTTTATTDGFMNLIQGYTFGDIVVKDCDATSTSTNENDVMCGLASLTSMSYVDSLIIENSTFSSPGARGILTGGGVKNFQVINSRASVTGGGTVGKALQLGYDSTLPYMPVSNYMQMNGFLLSGNTFELTTSETTHGSLIGFGCINGTITGNTFSGGNINCVIQGGGHSITENFIDDDEQGLLLKGASDCYVANNYIRCSSTDGSYCLGYAVEDTTTVDTTVDSATDGTTFVLVGGAGANDAYNGFTILVTDADDSNTERRQIADWTLASKEVVLAEPLSFTPANGDVAYIEHYQNDRNIIEKNIFVADGSTYCIYDADSDWYTTRLDKNIYVVNSPSVFSGDEDTMALHKTNVWAAKDWAFTANDENSRVQTSAPQGTYMDIDGDGTKEWIGIPQAGGGSPSIFTGTSKSIYGD